jgi:hypothetical protein
MNLALAADRLGVPRVRESLREALQGIRGPQVRITVLFGLATLAFVSLVNVLPVMHIAQRMPLHLMLLGSAIEFQIKAFVLLVAILMADRAVDHGARQRRSYVVAALGGCIAGVALSDVFNLAWRTLVLPDQWPDSRPWLRGTAWYVYWPIYDVTTWLLLGGFAVFFYADRRAARKTEARLREAELEHLRKSKLALESRLQAMQARVEPQFLFNTLSQVERLYELDRSIGQRMLDDLIVYLRAAMPLMRSTSSTVAQELELARAYLNIVKVRLGNRLTFEIDVPEGIGDACLPPMMLLPLIDHAIVVGLEKTHAEGRIRIGVEPSGKNLRLVVVDSGAGFIPEAVGDGIGAIRDRLEALYGGRADLVLRRRAEGSTEAVMHIPLENPRASSD